MKIEQILTKKPFKRILPNSFLNNNSPISNDEALHVAERTDSYIMVRQEDFLREYYPSGHLINDEHYYPNRIKTDENGKQYVHYVERAALPIQQVITTKQLTHLCGNPIEFTNSKVEQTEEEQKTLREFKQAWIKKNMDIAFYNAAKSEKITGDAAVACFFYENKLQIRNFSFLNDEVLIPHYNTLTGELMLFARLYKTTDIESGNTVEEFLEVWDNKYVTTYCRKNPNNLVQKFANKIKKTFNNDWDILGEPILHGFNYVPIAYKRSDLGACWSVVQSSIEQFEKAISQLCENNKINAFRIMYLQGDSIDIQFDSTGTPTAIVGDKDTDAKYLERADISNAFETQLKILTQNIFMGAFTVLPPEVKGGDLSGVTIKLLYSPAVEKAIYDAKEWDTFIDQLTKMFKFGYGVETKNNYKFDSLDVQGEVRPYVHQNEQEIITNINQSVLAGSLSEETAAEIHPYATTNEYERITRQKQKEMQATIVGYDNNGDNDYNKAQKAVNGKEL